MVTQSYDQHTIYDSADTYTRSFAELFELYQSSSSCTRISLISASPWET